MTSNSNQRSQSILGLCLSLTLLLSPTSAIAHAGHGDEFKSTTTQPIDAIKVDPETAKRLQIKVEPVKSQQLVLAIQTTGQIAALPDRKVEITSPIKGSVIELFVQPGASVRAGQTVAILSSPELGELRVIAQEKRAEAEVDLRLAQQNYDRHQQIAVTNIAQAKTELKFAQESFDRDKNIAQAKTELKFAQESFDRDKELLTRGAIPRRQLLESETKLFTAKAATNRAESKLDLLQAESEVKRAQSKIQLSDAAYQARLQQLEANANPDGTVAIVSPIDGIVSDREISLGESVAEAGKALMTIVDNGTVLATANVYEKDLGKIKIGQSVRVKVTSLPSQTFEGKISMIGAVVEGDSRVIPVKAELDNAAGLLKPGMFAELELATSKSTESVLVIPRSSIVEANGKQIVYIQNGDAFQPVEVSLGRESGDLVEVIDGVFEGDAIVTQRATQIYAQSLRGGNKSESKVEETTSLANVAEQVPWWILLIGGIGGSSIAAGAFWLGRRSTPKMVIIREPLSIAQEERIDK